MATHSSILDWRIPWTEEPGRLHTVHGVTESDTTKQLTLSLIFNRYVENKIKNRKRIVFSINEARKIGYSCALEEN